MARPTLTPAIAHAASTDAGNASMRAAGRTSWNQGDRDAAVAEYHRIMPEPYVLDCTPTMTAYYITAIVSAGDLRGKTFVVESYLSRYTDSPSDRKVLEDAWREQHGQKIDHFVYPHTPVYTPSFGTRTADVAEDRERNAGPAAEQARVAVADLERDKRHIEHGTPEWDAMTTGEHAECWWLDQGHPLPDRGAPEGCIDVSKHSAKWQAMYEKWHAYAFADFPNGADNDDAKRLCKICDEFLTTNKREICEPCTLKLAEHEAQQITEERYRDALDHHFS